MKRIPTLAGLLVGLSFGAAFAATPPPCPPTPAAITTACGAHQFTLANGMQLIVQPDHRAPTAVHMVWVRGGSMDEADGRSGLAPSPEQNMFKSSKTRSE